MGASGGQDGVWTTRQLWRLGSSLALAIEDSLHIGSHDVQATTCYTGMNSRSISTFETRYPARSTSEMAEEIAACNDSAVRSNKISRPSACPRIDASRHPALPRASVASRMSSCAMDVVGIITEN